MKFENGTVMEKEKKLADAHPYGKKPFGREDYIRKFSALTEGLISKEEGGRFLDLVQKIGAFVTSRNW